MGESDFQYTAARHVEAELRALEKPLPEMQDGKYDLSSVWGFFL